MSVVVPNWNGGAFLGECLDSLRGQTYPRIERILVDDGSTDGSGDMVARVFPEVQVIRLARNGRFARAANTGFRAARGEIVALLNNDAVADARWIEELVAALARHPEAGFVASKILLQTSEPRIHSAGDILHGTGIPDSRGAWEADRGQYAREELVFSACGGAAAYRRQMLNDIGLFDERLVMYCEDVDLAFRAQRAGYRCVYAPRAVVRHRLGASGSPRLASFLVGRNTVWLLARDVPGIMWRRRWPHIVVGQVAAAATAARHVREPAARARLRGIVAGLVGLPSLVRQRGAMTPCPSCPEPLQRRVARA